jgi:hypothetical protein
MIVVNASESVAPRFASCEQAATTDCGYCMPFEDDLPVWVCRGLEEPIAEVWTAVKKFE